MRHVFVCIMLALLAAIGETASPDGGLVGPPSGFPLREPAQRALIRFDADTGYQRMILQVDFQGSTGDFAWLVPVPALPDTLATAEFDILSECSRLTEPIMRHREIEGCGEDKYPTYHDGSADNRDVTVYENRAVGPYHTLVLGAENASALADSLEDWGYLHEENRTAAEDAFRFYIDKQWYFIAMRLDLGWGEDEIVMQSFRGAIEPILIGFATDEMVYPMRISAISAEDPTELLLYVHTAHRVTFTGARTEYAHRIRLNEWERLRTRYPHMTRFLERPGYLTKLRADIRVADMDDDLDLRYASTDDEFWLILYSGVPFPGFLLLAAFWIYRARRTRRHGERDRLAPVVRGGACVSRSVNFTGTGP